MRSHLPPDFPGRLKELRRLFRRQLGLRGRDMTSLLPRTRRHVPGHVQAALMRLAEAEQEMQHPVLRVIQEANPHDRDVKLVRAHLLGVDVADRRKGWWLGMAGSMAFNILLFVALLVTLLWWLGVIPL